ncbi:MAG: 7TM diverse intracellular signaling domain-containing protein [Leptospiraceae bacterium]|nr:7TM diverse intracellular signaling domain-containing protein [Leptospiraceae bacterium]
MQISRILSIIFISVFFILGCKINKTGVIVLNEGWEYRLGFERVWLFESEAGPWEKITLPENLTKKLKVKDGYITLRKEIPEQAMNYVKEGSALALNMGRVLDVSLYYLNGEPFAKSGSDIPYASAAMRPVIREIPNKAFKLNEKNYLYVVLYSDGSFPHQIMDEVKIGRPDFVFVDRSAREVIAFFFLTSYLCTGIYHILLAIKRPKDIHNLYYGIFSLVASIYWFIANTATRDLVFGERVYLQRKLEHVFLFSTSPLLLVFLSQYFLKRYNRASVYLSVGCYTLIIVSLVSPLPVMRVCSMIWQASNIFVAGYLIYFIVKQFQAKNQDAKYLIIGLVLLATGAVSDILVSQNILKLPPVSHYTFFLFVIGIATIMANKFMTVTNDFEALNIELEKKVEDRTKELQNTLNVVQKLKEQQDGDYYLTSLLLKPLSGNFTNIDENFSVKVEMLAKQKKSFEFRNKKNEIGGDIIIAETILMKGESFTVFANGDAMGKSIQGAGGALVFGTVLRAIIERTKNGSNEKNEYPEIWLRECYLELQRVFVTFDGSMLISCIIGLIQNKTGYLYYINCEHPYLVLYRDETASFVNPEIATKKLGVVGSEHDLIVCVEELKKDDAIISGSDGKDDLLLGTDTNGNRVINENENLFLRLLEKNKGELKGLPEVITNMGEITDDLSLLKVSYLNKELNFTEPQESKLLEDARQRELEDKSEDAIELYKQYLIEHGEHPQILYELASLLAKQKDFKNASEALDRVIYLNPKNQNALYLASYTRKKIKEYNKAIVLGERFRARNPNHILNLVNLADLYRITRQNQLTLKYLDEALRLEPTNEMALKLKHTLEEQEASKV